MTTPGEASQNLADSVKQTLQQAVDTLTAASDKFDKPEAVYDKNDLRATWTELASTSILGGLKLAETALGDRQRRPSDGLLVLVDHLASIAQRTLHHVRGVAEQTTTEVGTDPFRSQPWIDAATKLADIAVVNGIEAAQTIAIGPARYADRVFVSDGFPVAELGTGKLEVASGFTRPGDDKAIPNENIAFSPAVLDAAHKEFRVLVNETGLPSGVYLGSVKSRGGGEQTIALRL